MSISEQQRVLRVALALNAAMFVIGLAAGLVAESLGLIADSLDMLAGALAYGLSLAAIGRAAEFKSRVAQMSGSCCSCSASRWCSTWRAEPGSGAIRRAV